MLTIPQTSEERERNLQEDPLKFLNHFEGDNRKLVAYLFSRARQAGAVSPGEIVDSVWLTGSEIACKIERNKQEAFELAHYLLELESSSEHDQ
ncbi:MAG: hypothetical protein HY731_12065 [Candidatus Tectomicrobia bacterium]|nr:hypothetical protein [Candidatus Tectomicrobia bacterium]